MRNEKETTTSKTCTNLETISEEDEFEQLRSEFLSKNTNLNGFNENNIFDSPGPELNQFKINLQPENNAITPLNCWYIDQQTQESSLIVITRKENIERSLEKETYKINRPQTKQSDLTSLRVDGEKLPLIKSQHKMIRRSSFYVKKDGMFIQNKQILKIRLKS